MQIIMGEGKREGERDCVLQHSNPRPCWHDPGDKDCTKGEERAD